MNSEYEKNSMTSTSLEKLIQANGQAVETRQRIPYETILYAIPEEWREKEMNLLEEAVKFQPTLFQMIRALATHQDLTQLLGYQQQILQKESQYLQDKMRCILQQDGSVREKFSSEISQMLSDRLRAMEHTAQKLEQRIGKLIRNSVILSVVTSVLACVVWQLLVR